ncbi:MAG: taurine ABC transporter substrate-binding protein [Candidatus Rokuibacteriota bacterium]|nr:MAG: taurine ABC transporter substrate-binding protein [Candidatus Rokubacteria bacterium]
MRKLLSAALAVAAWGLVGGPVGSSPAAAETIKIAHSTWVGYGPLYIARDRGFFKNHGVEVELTVMEDPKLRFTALRAGQINVIASTVDTALLYLKKPDDFKYVAAIDDSNGGDGIVATRDIQSIKDLKGKKVAVNEGSVSQFYLNVLLAKAGLKESDLQTVNMTAADAGSAFVAKKVDAAVTWEPWLSRGKASEHGHLLTDSSKTPGLITDVFIVPKEFVATHKKELKGIVAAWNEAVAYQRAHPDEANQIMAKGVGGWLKDPKVFAETLTGIKFYGAEDNKNFFGTKANPGPLSQTVKEAIDVWSSHGKIQVKTTPSDLIDYEFVNE